MAAIFVSSSAISQTPGRDARAVTALTQALSAMGASGAGALTDSVTVVQVGQPGQLTETSTVTTLGADRMRVDTVGPRGASSRVLRNGAALLLSPPGTNSTAVPTWRAESPGNAGHERLLHLPGPMLAWELARQDVGVDWVGAETLGGAAVTHLRLRRVVSQGTSADAILTKNSEMEVYLDAAANTVTRIEWRLVSTRDVRLTQTIANNYDDYRPVSSPVGTLLLPFHVITSFGGKPTGEARVTSFNFNTGVDPKLFLVKVGQTDAAGGQ